MISSTQQGHSPFLQWADDRGPANPFTRLIRNLIRLILITMKGFKENDLSLRSSALTYTVLLSLVPILAMSTALVKGLGGGDQLRDVAYTYLETLEQSSKTPTTTTENSTPQEREEAHPADASLTGHLRSALDTLFEYVDNTNFAAIGSFGIAGILVSVILVFGTIETALNQIWNVTAGRSIIRKISDYVTIMVLMPISINVAFAASAFLKNPTLSDKFGMLIPFAWLEPLILKLVPIFFIALTFYVIYIIFPNTKVRNIPAMVGAVLAAVLWFTVQNVYITMQVGVAKQNAIYGSFATLPLFLVWMYLGWLFILTGAQIAYTLQNLDSYRLLPHHAAPSVQLSAAFDIMRTIREGYSAGTPINRTELFTALMDYDTEIIQEGIAKLETGGLLLSAQESELLVPAGPVSENEKQQIIDTVLGTSTPDTEGGQIGRQVLETAGSEEKN